MVFLWYYLTYGRQNCDIWKLAIHELYIIFDDFTDDFKWQMKMIFF